MTDCERCRKLSRRLEQWSRLKRDSDRHWVQAAKEALEGKPQNLINRMAMYEDYPVDATLS